ncbi:hypothetical protein QYE76_015714 [Lolium multiflorum]|uniref:Transposase (putative) gypsy type domain-containing protein n=1 Tax=Lolium multiflorum TaxID=4521 RepID=A0AAD8X9F7_LOLMU|nr:hypothetical protein QYE76_015714 [Lolium multiflorum]
MATPIFSAPPPFVPIRLDPSKDSGKETEGTSAHPEKTSGAGQSEQQTEEAAKKSKARKRDWLREWWPCTTTEMEPKNLESEGFLQPAGGQFQMNQLRLQGRRDGADELVERGFSFPPSDFFREILKTYGLQPHNISPNSVLAEPRRHCEATSGNSRASLFQYYFSVKKEKIRQTSELATCGSDVSDPASDKKLPPFKNCPATELPSWTHCPHFSDSPQLTRTVRRICKLTEEGLTGKDLTLSWFTKRIQPLQHRDRLMFEYTGRDDPMRATRIISPPTPSTRGSGSSSKSHVNSTFTYATKTSTRRDPELRSRRLRKMNSELSSESHPPAPRIRKPRPPEAPRPAKRKKPAPSGPYAKRPRETLSIAATRKAEAEKKRLALINTSNKGQPAIQHFFKPSGSGNQPPKAPRVIKKKAKPSPASFPITPEVEVPPKASSAKSRIRRTSLTLMTFLKTLPTMATPPRGPPHPFLHQINQVPLLRGLLMKSKSKRSMLWVYFMGVPSTVPRSGKPGWPTDGDEACGPSGGRLSLIMKEEVQPRIAGRIRTDIGVTRIHGGP